MEATSVDKSLVKLSLEDQDLLVFEIKQHNGYLRINTGFSKEMRGKFKRREIHRIVAERMGLYSCKAKALMIDHINRDKMDNSRENLRLVTARENQLNSLKVQDAKGGTRPKKKWHALISINGKTHYLGRFDTQEEVHEIRRLSMEAGKPIKVKHRYKGCSLLRMSANGSHELISATAT